MDLTSWIKCSVQHREITVQTKVKITIGNNNINTEDESTMSKIVNLFNSTTPNAEITSSVSRRELALVA